jgi:hypothetical protein
VPSSQPASLAEKKRLTRTPAVSLTHRKYRVARFTALHEYMGVGVAIVPEGAIKAATPGGAVLPMVNEPRVLQGPLPAAFLPSTHQ